MSTVFAERNTRADLPPLMCVGPENLDRIWPFAEPLLRKAYAEMDEFMPSNLLQWLKQGKGQLWVGIEANRIVYAFTTSLEARPSGLCLRVLALGGEGLEHIRTCESILAKFARDEGCVKITSEGRNGWVRSMPGYKMTRAFFEKEL